MGFKALLGSLIGGGAALVVLAACAGGGSQVATPPAQGLPPQAGSSFARNLTSPVAMFAPFELRAPLAPGNGLGLRIVDPDTIKAQIYVGQYGVPSAPGLVNDYSSAALRKNPLCQITNLDGVNAIEVDSTGELWIPQVTSGGVSEITSNAPNCGAAGTKLSDPNGQPADIAFASTGVRYVSDLLGNGSVAGDISVYPKGKTKPSSKLTNSAVFFSLGVAVDSHNNVFQSFVNQAGTKGGVLEFVGGKMPGKVVKGIKLTEPGTLIIDKSDNLIVTDQVANTLDTYAPPYTTAPATFPLKGQSIQCSINAAETNIACADRANDTADIYNYPSGTYIFSFNAKLSGTLTTIGIAQDPRE